MTLTNKTKQIIFHKSCKCVCGLIIVGNNKQEWNKNKCRYKCLINKKCGSKFWNPNGCKCEYRAAQLTEKCEEITDNKTLSIKSKTNVSTKKHNKESNSIDSCKPFIGSSVFTILIIK